MTVTVLGENDAPSITSNGGGDSATVTYNENATSLVADVDADDVDSGDVVTFSLVGGDTARRWAPRSDEEARRAAVASLERFAAAGW